MENMSGNKDNVQQEEISLKELILKIQSWIWYLLSKWYILLLGGIIGGTVGFFYAKSKEPIYTATTTFVLESGKKGSLSQYSGMAAMVGIDIGNGGAGGIFQGENIFELYKSRKMLKKALLSRVSTSSDQLLIERYIEFNNLREVWRKQKSVLLDIDFKDLESLDSINLRHSDSLITVISKDINSNVLKVGKPKIDASLIKVDVISKDEIFSKSFNETIVRVVNDFYLQTKTAKSLKNIAILESKVDSVRSTMIGAIYAGANVIDATPHLNVTRQAQRVAPVQKAQFSTESNKAILGSLVQNLEIAKMELMHEEPLIQVVDSPVLPLELKVMGVFKGVVIGGFFFAFLTLFILTVLRWCFYSLGHKK